MILDIEKIKIDKSWRNFLEDEFKKEYFWEIKNRIIEDKKNGFNVFPKGDEIFSAFDLTPVEKVKVVILGQDPYHGFGQAHGLCFSVRKGVKIPPSLRNIYKELNNDLGFKIPSHGDLTNWAKQGVLLLNASLTVLESKPMSHSRIGREIFTDNIIKKLSYEKNNLIFVLWGGFAIGKKKLIDSNKHKILTAPHPSPLSATRGFFGSKHFSKINNILQFMGKNPINWKLDL